MDIFHRWTSCLELGIIVIEISINAVFVAILPGCILHELVKVGSKCSHGCLVIKGGKSHDNVHERSNNLGFSIHNECVVL